MNKEIVNKLYVKVDNILANLSYKDYYQTNYKNGKKRSKRNMPYSLSSDTLEALNMLKLIKEDMTKEDEETVKGFILKYFKLYPDFIYTRP